MDLLRQLHTIPPFDKSSADYYPVLYEIPHLPVFFVIGYLIIITLGPKIMKNKTEWKLEKFTRYWNLFLSILSFIIFINIIPYLVQIYATKGLYSLVCMDKKEIIWNGFQQFCSWVFTMTKFIELIDTLILILKKREVIFLHWYHHTTVLCYTWYCTYTNVSIGWTFCTINAFVHTLMYYYYYLRASGFNPSWGKLITQIQLLQMVLGIYIASAWSYYYWVGDCPEPYFNETKVGVYFVAASTAMYGSYFLLFLKFYFGRWTKKTNTNNNNNNNNTTANSTNNNNNNSTRKSDRSKKE